MYTLLYFYDGEFYGSTVKHPLIYLGKTFKRVHSMHRKLWKVLLVKIINF